jgi:hypothetical protein
LNHNEQETSNVVSPFECVNEKVFVRLTRPIFTSDIFARHPFIQSNGALVNSRNHSTNLRRILIEQRTMTNAVCIAAHTHEILRFELGRSKQRNWPPITRRKLSMTRERMRRNSSKHCTPIDTYTALYMHRSASYSSIQLVDCSFRSAPCDHSVINHLFINDVQFNAKIE